MKTCPHCAESIEDAATTCPHCRSDVRAAPPLADVGGPPGAKSSSPLLYILGGLLILSVLVVGGFALLLVSVQSAGSRAHELQCRNNLKNIALALMSYRSANGDKFPPAYVADGQGRPMHSWRVLILPYLDQQNLYKSYDFTQPWDSQANQLVLENMPREFACPSHTGERTNTTSYAAVFGPGCVFSGPESVSGDDVSRGDGMSSTLIVGESTGAAIPWTKPQDIDIRQHPNLNDPEGFSSVHEGGVHFVTADGAAHLVSRSIDPQTLGNLFLYNDGSIVGDGWQDEF